MTVNWKNALIGLLIAVLVIGVVGPTTLGAQLGASSASAQADGSVSCDYAELYQQTNDSVVLISQERGQGSGFVYETNGDGSGYVVTNQHVLGDARRVDVTFRGGQVRTGTVVGTARAADLGVVRVEDVPESVSALPVAESAPRPGERVAALGSPFGLRGTITHGIVSSTDRSVPTDRGFSIPDVIQTDAPINPGNSGGPLVTCDGTVVGVNTAGLPAARAENIGFAVSASLINRVVPELIATGEFEFAYLGVQTVDLTPALAEATGLNVTQGVMVVETIDGSPAEGVLQEATRTATGDRQLLPTGGDVIVAIDDSPVRSGEDLSSYLATEVSPGDEVELTVVRNGEEQTVTVTLDERPSPP